MWLVPVRARLSTPPQDTCHCPYANLNSYLGELV